MKERSHEKGLRLRTSKRNTGTISGDQMKLSETSQGPAILVESHSWVRSEIIFMSL